MKTNLIKKIFRNYRLQEKDKVIIVRLVDEAMDIPRCEEILDFIIELKLDKSSIIGFLGYQLFKVKPEKADEISQNFTKDELSIYNGFKNLKDIRYVSKTEEAEDIRKMFLGMGNDIRVVVIKLAGILYDVKHLSLPLNEVDKDFVANVKEVFAPLAERLGLSSMKSYMEDYCFKLQDPVMYNALVSELERQKESNEKQIEITKARLQIILNELGLQGEIQARQKHVSSIFRKIKAQNVTMAQIYDLIAMRVLVNTVEDCYAVFGKIHAIYKPVPGRVKDYISNPKPNGYQTLHTTVIVENKRPLEIQIRTFDMHKNCEYGIAAHWIYKEKRSGTTKLDKKLSWFREIMENAHTLSPEDFIESLKTNLYSGEIFVQTPKGKVLEFPNGSTIIDFAYAVHSEIGNHCTGGKINNVMKPLYTELKNGDVVEIITSQSSKGPSRDWLNHVKTSSARSKIKNFFKNELVGENIKSGKTMFEEAAKARNYSAAQLLDEKYIDEMLFKYSMASLDELYAAIGSGSLVASQVVGRFIALYGKEHELFKPKENVVKISTNADGVIIDGATGLLIRYAGCCHPVVGDDIVGYISHGNGVTVHRKDCQNLKYLESERLIDAEWEDKVKTDFIAEIRAQTEKGVGMINKITNALMLAKISIRAFEVKEMAGGLEFSIVLFVKNKSEIEKAINSLSSIKEVKRVYRAN